MRKASSLRKLDLVLSLCPRDLQGGRDFPEVLCSPLQLIALPLQVDVELRLLGELFSTAPQRVVIPLP